jgi:hypothetical protein
MACHDKWFPNDVDGDVGATPWAGNVIAIHHCHLNVSVALERDLDASRHGCVDEIVRGSRVKEGREDRDPMHTCTCMVASEQG